MIQYHRIYTVFLMDFLLKKIQKIINHLEKTAENTSEELKYMIKELKPAALEKNSLKDALITHCELFSARQDIEVNTNIENIKKLTPEHEYSIYRIVQEACTNIQKHYKADLVNITIKKDNNNKVNLTIIDNGKGFNINKIKRGNGLNNMELRTKQVGGNFEIKSQEQKGTTIKAEFPI